VKKNLAWHFVGDKLRGGRPVPKDGVWLEHNGELSLCESGLHWSRDPFDALQYAPGPVLCLVEVGGEIIEGDDKGISTRRKIIARMDATELLRYFARMQALSAIHLNEDLCGNETVVDYLMTGDESLRDAAWDAARDAARAAAWHAERDAAMAAARAAAWHAERAAAMAAAMAAAWHAAMAAARDAAWAAARDAAWAAAWAAARDAAWAAAMAAARDAARQHFNDLVRESFGDFL
jgi:hypothetical protein